MKMYLQKQHHLEAFDPPLVVKVFFWKRLVAKVRVMGSLFALEGTEVMNTAAIPLTAERIVYNRGGEGTQLDLFIRQSNGSLCHVDCIVYNTDTGRTIVATPTGAHAVTN